MNNENNLYNQLATAKKLLYDKCLIKFSVFEIENESREYEACSFNLNNLKILYRASKITPTKAGQFVTIWKRNEQGITQPFNYDDDFDVVIISSQNENNLGQFIFPKNVLLDKGIITGKFKNGKRGIRVYPPWDIVTNKQAEKTQAWQTKYFLSISSNNKTDFKLAKELFNNLCESRVKN